MEGSVYNHSWVKKEWKSHSHHHHHRLCAWHKGRALVIQSHRIEQNSKFMENLVFRFKVFLYPGISSGPKFPYLTRYISQNEWVEIRHDPKILMYRNGKVRFRKSGQKIQLEQGKLANLRRIFFQYSRPAYKVLTEWPLFLLYQNLNSI